MHKFHLASARFFGFIFGFVFVCGCVLVPASLAQEIARLSDDENQAMQAINERVVKSALIFLSSDALEGRGTPSRGFDIACEYVAARFQAAGLKGLGQDGSFFQAATVDTVQAPDSGISLTGPGNLPVQYLGLLCGGEQDVSYTGKLSAIRADEDLAGRHFEGPVIVHPLSGSSRSLFRQLGTLGRLAIQLKTAGATAILLKCSEDSQLIEYAKNATQPQIENRRVKISLPVVLIDNLEVPDADPPRWSGVYSLVVPKQIRGQTVVRNTIGILPGSDPDLKDEAIIFTAHLDHLGISGAGEDRINNGADDNASGSTAVLSLADAYCALKTPPRRSVIFMTFWGEERGLLGSRHYCDQPIWPLAATIANINIEMIGRPEAGAVNKAWMTGWDQSDLGILMAQGSPRGGLEIFDHPRYGAMLYRASDNYSFVQCGVIAHSFSAGSLHADYHKPTDEFDRMNTEHMTQVIRGLFAGSLPIANGEITPQATGSR